MILKRIITNTYQFCKEPNNQPIASWIQTIVVVAGVIIALGQLNSSVSQLSITQNTKYLEIIKNYERTTLGNEMFVEESFHSIKRNSNEIPEQLDQEKLVRAFDDIYDGLYELSSCALVNVCPVDAVSNTLCWKSELIYFYSNHIVKAKGWKYDSLQRDRADYYRFEYCGLFKKMYFAIKGDRI